MATAEVDPGAVALIGEVAEITVVVSAGYVVVKAINDVIGQLLQAAEYIRQFVGGFVSQFKARVTARPTPLGALAAAITGAGISGAGQVSSLRRSGREYGGLANPSRLVHTRLSRPHRNRRAGLPRGPLVKFF